MINLDFIETSSIGAGFVYKTPDSLFYFDGTNFLPAGVNAVFTATTGSGTPIMNISAVTSGKVGIGQAITGGTLTGTLISSFNTFNGTSGTVNLATSQTWANPTTVTATTSYPPTTVKGIVYLDGTYYVMTPDGAIHGSNINDPTAWDPLNVIQSQSEPDGGICLARQLNLIVAFGSYSTEFFYDAANPTGSPLLPYTSAFLEVGCATSGSVINAENSIIFMSVGRQKGREISILEGTVPKTLSTPYINRILNADNLSNVVSYFIKVQGHGFYILTLPSSNLTLVYDITTGKWAKWTQLSIETSENGSAGAATWANGKVTMVRTGHTIKDGDYVTVSGYTPSGYNGNFVVNVEDSNTISYSVPTTLTSATIVGTVKKFNESYFNMASYTNTPSFDLVQDSTTGVIYSVSSTTFMDGTNPIKYGIRTSNIDGGNNHLKFYSRLELIGDKVTGTGYLRFSDDDYQSWIKYRPVDLSKQRSQLYRLGSSRRRAYEIINYDNQPIRLNNIELSVEKGFT
jgi:Phage stabilisation protein